MTRRRNARPPSSCASAAPAGSIGMANWMPEGFGLDFFLPHAEANPPPPELASPLRWGTAVRCEYLQVVAVRR